MKQKEYNVASVTFAVLLHVGLFGSMFVVFDFDRTPDFAIPLAINATLVTENAVITPPKVEEPPIVKEPPPQPDTREQERVAAEQEKREQDARDETARLQKIEDDKAEAELKRLAEAEALKESQRQLAEEERLKEVERQRVENARIQKEEEDAARQAALDEEAAAIQASDAIVANAKTAYIFAIQQDIKRNWVRPANAQVGLECVIIVQQTAGGIVTNVEFGSCNGDANIRRSIEAAVNKASPLPAPRDPSVFDRDIRLTFRPEE